MAPKETDRETLVQTAIEFLTHPKVKSSPVKAKRDFLVGRGLTAEEIEMAFQSAEKLKKEGADKVKNEVVAVAPAAVTSTLPSTGSSMAAILAKSILALGSVGGVFVTCKSYVLPMVKRWSEDLMSFGERQFQELKALLMEMQLTQQEQVGRMEGLMRGLTAEVSSLNVLTEEFRSVQQRNEETNRLLVEIKELLQAQARCASENEMKRDENLSSLDSSLDDPETEEHSLQEEMDREDVDKE